MEEVLRWTSPVRHFMRTAAEEYVLRGKQIRKGDYLMMSYVSANFDEEVFPTATWSVSTARPTGRWRSASACRLAWASTWGAWSSRFFWRNCWGGCRTGAGRTGHLRRQQHGLGRAAPEAALWRNRDDVKRNAGERLAAAPALAVD